MRSAKQFLAILLCAMWCLSPIRAQEPAAAAKAGQDVTVIIERQQVRFAARAAVEQMQLQVFNQTGELIFDSGLVAGGEINWPFQNGDGVVVKSGLYAYALSIKEVGKEAGAESARMRRGHFIVDRAADRDTGADRIWITSHRADVGAELTVARDESVTVAGVSTNPERTAGRATGIANRDANGRTVEAETVTQPEANKTASAAAPAATAGRIVKYATAFDLGDSVIAEQNGNIGIGTSSPASTLDVRGKLTLDPGAGNPVVLYTAASGGEQNRYLELINSPNSPSASGLKAGGVLVADNYNFAQPGKNNLVVKGVVGIGTATPASELHVAGLGPFITLESRQNGISRQAYIQNADGNLVFKSAGFGACCAAMVIQPNSGNVGIGTSNPANKLQVEGAGIVEAAIISGNERAILGLTNTIGPSRYTWTLESGLYGSAGLFGIYNRVVNKSGLEIDGNLLVSVKALQITGGADLAEKFDVLAGKDSGGTAAIQPGMVVTIDPANPGKLSLSQRAYDRRVAGVISGAGGVKPGMMLGQEGTLANGNHPVALGGRVYVWADASHSSIQPGDLLTTSSTPGHAMKAIRPSKASGAIIGKAMTALKSGQGLVLVLVTLQ